MGILAVDSDGCCAADVVLSRRNFSTFFSSDIHLREFSRSLIYERETRIRRFEGVFSGSLNISGAMDFQAEDGL